jgi:beta-phosphoglucomutase-like phosphatase (HAD superfamily)
VSWDVVVTGDDVSARKPDPEAFQLAVERLGSPAAVVAVEDSGEGLEAAKAAGLPCVVVVNGYTADHDLAAADLVTDGFGEPGARARVLADRAATGCDGIVDGAVLRTLAGAGRSPGSR